MHEKTDVCDTLWRIGEEMIGAVQRAIAASGAEGVSVEGIAPMWFLRFTRPSASRDSRAGVGAGFCSSVARTTTRRWRTMNKRCRHEHAASSAFVQLVEETQS